MRRQSRLESVVIGVCLLTILGLSFFYLYLRSTFRGRHRRRAMAPIS